MNDFGENGLDPQFWHACAGGMVRMPKVNSKVYYFPQGHAEHTLGNVDFEGCPRIPAMVLCRVAQVKFLSDQETDEVYARMMLVPVLNNGHYYELDGDDGIGSDKAADKPVSFAKTLTQSDANNGGGFSVPRYCADYILPQLDYTADPPVRNLIAKDVHGETWNFRYIYRGTPRRHLLTTGWSSFVNHKKLVARDSIVFLRADNGDICVGIRRAKRIGFGSLRGRGKVRPESVIEAASLAARGKPFEVAYYPSAGTPEFCVKASSVNETMRVQWSSGMKFKMAFETEESLKISWFNGTVASAQVADPIRWPNSPWRALQVTWDEPDLVQNVKCVSPWLVEIVPIMPIIDLLYSPPTKKLCLPEQSDNSLDCEFPLPSFSGDPLGDGIQGARHAQYGGVQFLDLRHNINKLQLGLLPSSCQPVDAVCKLTIENSYQKIENFETPKFLLFGQPILTAQQMSHLQTLKRKSSSPFKTEFEFFDLDCKGLQHNLSCLLNHSTPPSSTIRGYHATGHGLGSGHCKVFLDSEDVGRSLDLSVLGTYEELYKSLANMFGIEKSNLQSKVLYCDEKGALRRIGDESFSDFVKTAKRLIIVMKSNNNTTGRILITGLPTTDRGLDSSNQAGLLSIFA